MLSPARINLARKKYKRDIRSDPNKPDKWNAALRL